MSHPFHHLDLQPVVWPEQVTADTPTLMVDYRWGFASDKEKAQCAKAWVRALPQFTHLRSLYFYSTCSPPLLEAICTLTQLETLQFFGNTLKDLGPVSQLRGLRHLSIGPATKIRTLEPLIPLQQLTLLELRDLRAVEDFTPLLALSQLRDLLVGSNLCCNAKLRDVASFARMQQLTRLDIEVDHMGSPRPLAALTQLQDLALTGLKEGLHTADFAWLSVHMPDTRCAKFQPTYPSHQQPCRRCGQASRVELVERESPGYCTHCDAAKLAALTQVFDQAQQAARDEVGSSPSA